MKKTIIGVVKLLLGTFLGLFVIFQFSKNDDVFDFFESLGLKRLTKQFYKIIEMNWNNSKEVDSWRYYQNGDFIRESDEDLCKKLMCAEYAQKINWQG